MQTSPGRNRFFRYSQPDEPISDADLTTPHKPLPNPPRHFKFQPTFQLPRTKSIESLAESIVELEFPSPFLCNDPEMSQYMSENFTSNDFHDRQLSPYISVLPQDTNFYFPTNSDTARSSIINYGEGVLGSDLYSRQTRPSTVLLPEIPSRANFRQSDQTCSAPLRNPSCLTFAHPTLSDIHPSPLKRHTTLSRLDCLSAELTELSYFLHNRALSTTPLVPPPTTPTPSFATSASQASTLANSPSSTRSLTTLQRNRSQSDQQDMQLEKLHDSTQHDKMSAPRSLPHRQSRTAQSLPTHHDTNGFSIRNQRISQPLPSPKLPIDLPSPCFAPVDSPSQSRLDWSDDDDNSARRTIKAIKNAVSHPNLRAAGRARSCSTTPQKTPPVPALSHFPLQSAAWAETTAQQHRPSTASSALATRLSQGPVGQRAAIRVESPKKLVKKMSTKKSRALILGNGVVKVENPAARAPKSKRRRGGGASFDTSSTGRKKISIKRLKTLLKRLLC